MSGRRGSTYTTLAVLIPMLTSFTAMGVDWGMVSVARTQVQLAADSAALAAATSVTDPVRAQEKAEAFAKRTMVNQTPVSVVEFGVGFWDGYKFEEGASMPNAARVVTEAEVSTFFLRIFGMDFITVRAEAGAGPKVVPKRASDLVLVLDVTSSMSDEDMKALQEASLGLLDCIRESATPDSRVAITTFGGVDFSIREMTSYEEGGYESLVKAVEREVVSCRDGGAPCSNTNHAAGFESALRILERARTPKDVGQSILFMSDGAAVPYEICSDEFYKLQDAREIDFDVKGRCRALGCPVPDRRGRPCKDRYQPDEWNYENWLRESQREALDEEVNTYPIFYSCCECKSSRRDRKRCNRERDEQAFYLSTNTLTHEGVFYDTTSREQLRANFVNVCTAYTNSDGGLLF